MIYFVFKKLSTHSGPVEGNLASLLPKSSLWIPTATFLCYRGDAADKPGQLPW